MIKRPFSLCARTLTDESKTSVNFMAKKNGEIGTKSEIEKSQKNTSTQMPEREQQKVNEDGDQQNTNDNINKMCVLMLIFLILALCMFRSDSPADT